MLSELWATTQEYLAVPWIRASCHLVGSIILAYIVEFIVARILTTAARKTKTDLDDRVIEALRRPVFVSVILLGLSFAAEALPLPPRPEWIVMGCLKMVAVFVWSGAAFRVSTELLTALATRTRQSGLLQKRTMPVFDILIKVAVIGAAIYFTFLAWDIDVTAWLASAGIVGIAVGFAAKDTLANLFAGIFIIADSPFQVGDFVVLDGSMHGKPLRGSVTRIGMRSCRFMTLDDLEINVPNSVIGNSKIINETGGPTRKQRTRVSVSVAYGSDIDKVRDVLSGCTDGITNVSQSPAPIVRFVSFGDSGLNFDILFWIDNPAGRDDTQSAINGLVYKALAEADIEIPFQQHDLRIRSVDAEAAAALKA